MVKDADWAAIEDGFRQNMPLRKLAALYGSSAATIMRTASAAGWERGPSMAVQVADQVEDAAIADEAMEHIRQTTPGITAEDLTNEQVLKAAVARSVEVLRGEKLSVAQVRLAGDYVGRLLLRQLALVEKQAGQKLKDSETKELNLLTGVLGNPVTQLRTLALALGRMIPLERAVHALPADMKEGGQHADKKARQQRRDIGDVLEDLTGAIPIPEAGAQIH